MPETPAAKILSQTQSDQQVITTYEIENRLFITHSHFNPNGKPMLDLLVPIVAAHEFAENQDADS